MTVNIFRPVELLIARWIGTGKISAMSLDMFANTIYFSTIRVGTDKIVWIMSRTGAHIFARKSLGRLDKPSDLAVSLGDSENQTWESMFLDLVLWTRSLL